MALSISAEERDATGKSNNRKLREGERIPAVVYGRKIDNKNLHVHAPELRSVLKEGAVSNVLVELNVEGETDPREVLIKDVDIHPVESSLQHVDFHEVSPEDTVQVKVPVNLNGPSVGVEQEGGILFQPVREVMVECKATEIPEQVDVDITELDIGDVLFIRDIPTTSAVEILDDEDRTLVSIQPPKEYDLEPTVPEVGEEIEETVEEALEEAAEAEGEEIEGEAAEEAAEAEGEEAEGEPADDEEFSGDL
jgi:large subunit ribosomal protein L25